MIHLEHFGAGLRNPYRNPKGKELWLFYENDFTEQWDEGSIIVSPRAAKHGARGLLTRVDAGNAYLYCYPYDQQADSWHYLSEVVQRGDWTPQTYNRLSYWVRTPRGLRTRSDGGFNHHTSWFTRSPRASRREHESDNGKWYAYANLTPGCWNLVTVDFCHVHHRRNKQTREWGVSQTVPGSRSSAWVLDCTTAFYIDPKERLQWAPAEYSFDSFEISAIPKNEPIDEIYGVTAAYAPDKKTAALTWSKRRDDEGQRFDVYWSDKSITRYGLRAAQKVGEGIRGLGGGGYNACRWSGRVPLRGLSSVYLAIQKQGDRRFRQIKLDLK